MARLIKDLKTSYTSGEQEPKLESRRDIIHYYTGASKLRNVQVLPQGGARRRPGSEMIARVPRKLFRITVIQSATAPNGGDPNNANDENSGTKVTTTNAIGTTSPYVIIHYDLGSAVTVEFADVRDLKISAGMSVNEFRIQYSTDNAVWQDYGGVLENVSDAAINRRRRVTVTAQYWRVARVGGTDLTTATAELSGFWIWIETMELSVTRKASFRFSTEQRFMLTLSDRTCMMIADGQVVAYTHQPLTSDRLSQANWVQGLDTFLLFHRDSQTYRIQRQNSDTDWQDEVVNFLNIPTVTFPGESSPEPVWSNTRGWPQCGMFGRGRGWYGGSRQKPSTFAMSTATDLFDLDSSTEDDDKGTLVTLESDSINEIMNINAGRDIQMFCSDDEFYIGPRNDVITPKNIDPRITTNQGSQGPGLRVVQVEGAVLFVQQFGKAVREFLFTDDEQAYDAQRLSLLSSHLFDRPREMAVRKGSTTDDADMVFICNDRETSNPELRGSMIGLTTMRAEDVTSWYLWHTNGGYLSVAVDGEDIYTDSYRDAGGEPNIWVERMDDDRFLDASVRLVADPDPITVVTGLDHLEGAQVKIYADDMVFPPQTVSGGQVTLAQPAELYVEVGLAFPDVQELAVAGLIHAGHTEREARRQVYQHPTGQGIGAEVWIRDMPLEPNLPDGTVLGEMKRVVEAIVSVNETRHFLFRANNGRVKSIDGRRMGLDLLDQGLPLMTGDIRIEGLQGWTRHGMTEIMQVDPGPFTVLSVKRKALV